MAPAVLQEESVGMVRVPQAVMVHNLFVNLELAVLARSVVQEVEVVGSVSYRRGVAGGGEPGGYMGGIAHGGHGAGGAPGG